MERLCRGYDVVSHRMQPLKNHSVDLRFDMKSEWDTDNSQDFMVSLRSLRAIRKKGKLKNRIAWIEILYCQFGL